MNPVSSTLLLRSAGASDLAPAAALLRRWPAVPPGGRMVVLADVAGAAAEMVRAVAIVRPHVDSWVVDIAATDSRWPPAGEALVQQLMHAAAAAGATRLAVAPQAAAALASPLLAAESSIGTGGWVLVDV